jgi:hypothetical protein
MQKNQFYFCITLYGKNDKVMQKYKKYYGSDIESE